jgi:hypothetical protein
MIPALIQLQDRWLYWQEINPDTSTGPKEATATGALNLFVRLEQREDVARFAKRYGPLGITRTERSPHREAVKLWLDLSIEARNVLDAASKVHSAPLAEHERFLLVEAIRTTVQRWITTSDLRPALNWEDWHTSKVPRFVLRGIGTFAVLTSQLLLAVSNASTLVTCTGCGIVYLRTGRRPQAGRGNYCEDCGERAANRLRQRRWRGKQGGTS